jgi:long-chain acyl-CoA synthetase
VILLSELKKKGAAVDFKGYPKVAKDDIFTFSYTSGTTGEPKGAMISHMNMMATLGGCLPRFCIKTMFVTLSYLPLAHIYERIISVLVAYKQGEYVFFNGDVLKLAEDLAIVRPTFFGSVPRLYNRFYDKLKLAIS